ncbi:hypothetical protein Dia5BBH33_04140 [Dialister hominis]|uniref:Uncharacterized protein n=1 Tax=Dialister hominis TaxID=2582419 RepID=A0A8D4UTN1_9FIRM|nr:hypothetical protein Dia5BBH33_04140 [Dialister hominis]
MHCVKNGLAHHEHARPASVDRIVHLTVAVHGIVTGIRDRHLHTSRIQRSLDDTLVEERLNELGK